MSMSLVSDIKQAYKKGKDIALNAPEVERKVKDATSNDKWGPTGTQMQEISRASYNFQDFPIIMSVIWKRINDPGKYWRHVYKSLLLIDYLVRNGSEQVIRECRNHMIEVQTLTEFQHIEEDKDVGLSVRERAKQVIELLHDDKRIKAEREKAKANQGKYGGVGNDGNRGYGGEGYGDDSYGNGDRYGGSYGGGGGGGGGGDRGYGGGERYGSDRGYGGGDRDRGYGGGDSGYGGRDDDRYGSYSDRDRERERDRDSTRDYGKYDDNERGGYERPDDYNRGGRSSPPASSFDRAPSSTGSGNRPRAASGGERPQQTHAPQKPAQTASLFSIDDVMSAPAPPSQPANDLFGINTGGGSGFGGGFAPPAQQFGANANFGFPPAAQGDMFNPRGAGAGAGDQPEWSDFQTSGSSAGGEFNPFAGQQQGQPDAFAQAAAQAAEPQAPKQDDPWAKKGLFNLDSLNVADAKAGGAKTSSASPAKVPMASQPTKTPMAKTAMTTSASTLTARPVSTTLTPIGTTSQSNLGFNPAAPGFPPAGPYPGYPPTGAPGFPPGGAPGFPPGYGAAPYGAAAPPQFPPYGAPAAGFPPGAGYGGVPGAVPGGFGAGAAPRRF